MRRYEPQQRLLRLDPTPLHRRFLQLIATELADLAGGSPPMTQQLDRYRTPPSWHPGAPPE